MRELRLAADTALRARQSAWQTAQLWLNLQTDYDIEVVKRHLDKILDRIASVHKPKAGVQ